MSNADKVRRELIQELNALGYDTTVQGASDAIDHAVEYLELSHDYGVDMSPKEWVHVTQDMYPDEISFMKKSQEISAPVAYKDLRDHVKSLLQKNGYDIYVDGGNDFINSAVEYLEMSDEYGAYISPEEWLKETEDNYPEELEFMKPVDEAFSLKAGPVELQTNTIDNVVDKASSAAQGVTDTVVGAVSNTANKAVDVVGKTADTTLKNADKVAGAAATLAPLLADDASEKESQSLTFHNDNGTDYKVIARSKSGRHALLQNGSQYIIAWNCPEDSGSWGQGHYFFNKDDATALWNKKYFNESLNEDLRDDMHTYNYSDKEIDAANQWCLDNNISCDCMYPNEFEYVVMKANNYGYNPRSEYTSQAEWDNDFNAIIDRCKDRCMKESLFRESLYKKLTEAEISSEDKAESDLLRSVYNKINGKQLNPKSLTAEEKAVLDKYGIDYWGYKGDTKVVTGQGRKDIISNRDVKRDWKGRTTDDSKFYKVNYADKARKIDDRDYAQNVNQRYYYSGNDFSTRERNYQNDEMKKPVSTMKGALAARNSAQKTLDTLDADVESRIQGAANTRDGKIYAANAKYDLGRKYGEEQLGRIQSNIQAILDRHRVKECLASLTEASMSDEDKHDSEMIKRIYQKLKHRSNAALTDEEKAIIDKYNLIKGPGLPVKTKGASQNIISDNDFNARYNWTKHQHETPLVSVKNYADAARKAGTRDYAQTVNRHGWVDDTFGEKERKFQDREMSKDVNDMKNQLELRRMYSNRQRTHEQERDKKIADANAAYDQSVSDLRAWKDNARADNEKRIAAANDTINGMLKKEQLTEDDGESRVVSTGLVGKKYEDIVKSVLGQMSDGIWENTPGMLGYWYPINVIGTDIYINKDAEFRHGDRWIKNPYYNMSDDEVRRFFANKIKTIAQQYLHDNNLNPYKGWNPVSNEPCDYLSYHEDVTIADAYNAFKQLY